MRSAYGTRAYPCATAVGDTQSALAPLVILRAQSIGGWSVRCEDRTSAEDATTRMSRRLNRRQQRELEELKELDAIKADVDEEAAPEREDPEPSAPLLGVAAVCGAC